MSFCPDCCQTFSRRDNMLRHQKQKHTKINWSYPLNNEANPLRPTPQQSPPPPPPPPVCIDVNPPPPPPPMCSDVNPPPPPPPPMCSDVNPPPPPPPTTTTMCSDAKPPPPPHHQPQNNRRAHWGDKAMTLQHPFTMMISGPTACGKTTFVKELLQHHDTRIQPAIQRITFLYKRWQPLYAVIQSTVQPKVEFIQGIPEDLDDDDFFDPRLNNLIILDDLFAEAGKDKRITGLFTEGSHHRSLSIIAINQNLFGTKDPTQRRNCHYVLLYKTPIDSQAIMTLARQMYPGRSDVFMNIFAKATKAPYGYMLVDLKPFTPDKERLQSQVIWPDQVQGETELTNQKQEWNPQAIKEDTICTTDHSSVGVQTVNIVEDTAMADKMNACDDCGLLFDSSHDVQRHVKRGWCSENQDPPTKKRKLEEDTAELESMASVGDNEGFIRLWKSTKEVCHDRYRNLYDRYLSQGETAEDASDMAEERVKNYEERTFFSRYGSLLETYLIPLQHNTTHQEVLRQIQTLTDKGIPLISAVTRALKKTKTQFEDLFDMEVSNDEHDSEDESEDGDTDEEEDI